MATTITTHLSLIKPDTSESIKANLPTYAGWTVQNAANMDVIDSLFRAELLSYSPSWGATVTPPTLGAGGFVEGKYIRLWPRMVIVYFRIAAGGAGFNRGNGAYTISPPVAVDPAFGAFSHSVPVGKMVYFGVTGIASSVFAVMYDVATNLMLARPSAGGTWGATVPVNADQNNTYSGYFMYPTAVA